MTGLCDHIRSDCRAGRRTAVVWIVMALACTSAGRAIAQDRESGEFDILGTQLVLRDGVFYLDATASLELSAEAKNALASGLPLSISYQLEFLNRLRLWWDIEQETVRQRFQIEYHALTERYIVTDMKTGRQVHYSRLEAALKDVGTINGLETVEASKLDEDRRYDIRLRVVLDTERLPGPLRLIAFWRRDWSLASDWYTWRLDEE